MTNTTTEAGTQAIQTSQTTPQHEGTADVARQLSSDEGEQLRQPEDAPLFPADEAGQLQSQWQEVQAAGGTRRT